MTRHILLDSSPLSALCQPVKNPGLAAIMQWATCCIAAGHRLYIPEVIDYEVRRELLRAGKTASIMRLDGLKTLLRYLPIHTSGMLRAAEKRCTDQRPKETRHRCDPCCSGADSGSSCH